MYIDCQLDSHLYDWWCFSRPLIPFSLFGSTNCTWITSCFVQSRRNWEPCEKCHWFITEFQRWRKLKRTLTWDLKRWHGWIMNFLKSSWEDEEEAEHHQELDRARCSTGRKYNWDVSPECIRQCEDSTNRVSYRWAVSCRCWFPQKLRTETRG